MIRSDELEVEAISEYNRGTKHYIQGDENRGIFSLAFEDGYKNSVTTWLADKVSEGYDALTGHQQELVSVEQAKKVWNLEIEKPEKLSKVRHLARLNAFNQHIRASQELAKNKRGSSFYWTKYIGGIIAGGLVDPVLLVASGGVGTGVKAIGRSVKPVARALKSTNPYIRRATKVGLYGVPDATLNVGLGAAVSKNRGYDYGKGDALFDVAIGGILQSFFRGVSGGSTAIKNKVVSTVRDKINSVSNKVPAVSKGAAVVENKAPQVSNDNFWADPKTDKNKPNISLTKKTVTLDYEFISGIEGIKPIEIENAKVFDFYDRVLNKVDETKLHEAEWNVLTFLKANELNGAVSKDYIQDFRTVQNHFNALLKRVYDYVPSGNVKTDKTFFPEIEKDIAFIIDSIANNKEIPQTTQGLNDYLAPLYNNLADIKNIFSGRSLADPSSEIGSFARLASKPLSDTQFKGVVDKGLAIVDKLKPFKKEPSIIKKGIKKLSEPESVKALKKSKKIVEDAKRKVKESSSKTVPANDVLKDVNKVIEGLDKDVQDIIVDEVMDDLISYKLKSGVGNAMIVSTLNKYQYSLEDYYNKYEKIRNA